MGKNTKMNLGTLKTLENKRFTTKKIIVDSYELEVDEHFKNTKIVSLLQEFMKQTNYAKENDMEIDALTYTTILILKYFTSMDVPEEYEKQIQMLSILTDLEYQGENYLNIILSAFDENEINKLNTKMKEYAENLTKLVEEINKEKAEESEEVITEEVNEVTE